MKKTIIFGFDGTIVDSRDIVIELYNTLADKKNFKKINQLNVEFLSGLPLLERCKALNIPTPKIPYIAFYIKKHYEKILCSLNIQVGIIDVLNKLKENGFEICIISSNFKETIKEYLEINNINIFNAIYSSKNIFGKHHVINRFLKKYNLDRKDVLYVGGEVRDIISCKKIGVKIASVLWGWDSCELLSKEKPDFIANNPAELIDIAYQF